MPVKRELPDWFFEVVVVCLILFVLSVATTETYAIAKAHGFREGRKQCQDAAIVPPVKGATVGQ